MNASPRLDLPAQLAPVLRAALPNIMAAWLYGSAARGDQRPDSDIDIGVLLPGGQSLPNRLRLSASLYELTGRQIDLVDLRRAGNFLRMEVLREGRQILATDPDRVLAWEARAMGEYAQHRRAIDGILRDFARTGIGYHP